MSTGGHKGHDVTGLAGNPLVLVVVDKGVSTAERVQFNECLHRRTHWNQIAIIAARRMFRLSVCITGHASRPRTAITTSSCIVSKASRASLHHLRDALPDLETLAHRSRGRLGPVAIANEVKIE